MMRADELESRAVPSAAPREAFAVPSRSAVLGEIGGELIHGPAPPLVHAVAAGLEGLTLRRRGVVGLPAHGELGPAARLILEAEHRQHLQRPVLAQRMARGAAGFVRERTDKHQLLLRDDLAKGE